MKQTKMLCPVLGVRVIAHHVERLPVKLTEEELRERGRSMARIEGEIRAHAAHCEAVKKELKSKESALAAELCRLGEILRNESEERDVDIQLEELEGERKGRRRVAIVRMDNGEVVEERPMRDEELQQPLPLEPTGTDPQ
jgi:hypothetical protein